MEAVRTRVSHPLIFLGDINVNLHKHDSSDRASEIRAALALLDLKDVASCFRLPRDGPWTWSQWRQGRYIRSVTDCILSEHPVDFRKWALKTPRLYTSDHRLILAELMLGPLPQHRRYICQRQTLPSVILPRPLTAADQAFFDLLQFPCQPKPQQTQR
jgi:hypothetical protein